MKAFFMHRTLTSGMITTLALALWTSPSRAIVNGTDVADAVHPQVGLVLPENCTGTNLATQVRPVTSYILTAAHCNAPNPDLGFRPRGESGALVIPTKKRSHPDFVLDAAYLTEDHDLMLLEIPRQAGLATSDIVRGVAGIAVGGTYELVGLGRPRNDAGAIQKRTGLFTVDAVSAGGFKAQANQPAPPDSPYSQPGDSGGPYYSPTIAGGGNAIVAIHESGRHPPHVVDHEAYSTVIAGHALHYNWIDTYKEQAIFWDGLDLKLDGLTFDSDMFEVPDGERGISVRAEGWDGAATTKHPTLGDIDNLDSMRYRYVNAIGKDDDGSPELFVDGDSGQGAIVLAGDDHLISKVFEVYAPFGGTVTATIQQRWNSEGLGVDVGVYAPRLEGFVVEWSGLTYSSTDDLNMWITREVSIDVPAYDGFQSVEVKLVQTTLLGSGTPLLGDMDGDDDLDFDDIDDLVLGLNSPSEYEAMYGVPPSLRGDTDADMDFDFDDIPGFVFFLSGGAESPLISIPEPSTFVLGVIGLLISGWGRRRAILSLVSNAV